MTEYIEEDMLGIKELFKNKGTVKYNKTKILTIIGGISIIVVGTFTYFAKKNNKKSNNF